MTSKAHQEIGIAIIEQEGHYLLGIRQAGTNLAGKTEFPGGKREPEESILDCIVRESLEETGLHVIPVEEFYQCQFSYPHADVDLHFWICKLADETKGDSESHFWVKASNLINEAFPEANVPVIEKLLKRNGEL